MSLTFEHPFGQLTLQRYPASNLAKDKDPLQPWDAADHYLLRLQQENDCDQVSVVNDQFGALALGLGQRITESTGDSWLSWKAMTANAEINQLPTPTWNNSLIGLTQGAQRVLFKIPKSQSLLVYQLKQLAQVARQTGPFELWLGGMDKHLHKNQFNLVAKYFGPVNFLPGWKKARVWQATFDPAVAEKEPKLLTSGYQLDKPKLSLLNGPNVFCGDKLDLGSRFFLKHFSQLPKAATVADCGCGNGLLGIAYGALRPEAKILTAVDESYLAVQCAEANAQQNLNPDIQFVGQVGDALMGLEPASQELVLCNPPFHQQNTLTLDIAKRMFTSAKTALASDGELWVVANRHLPYYRLLKRLFKHCNTIATDSKFSLYQCVR